LSLEIDDDILENTCKNMIETILYCLSNAYKGTIYSIGSPPRLIAKRVTSGIIDEDRKKIRWGFPQSSEYNPPGKPWEEYMDMPDRPLEAMAWCVERQKSWTADDPENDSRGIRTYLRGKTEDYYHMEPVLVKKEDLNLGIYSNVEYPKNFKGEIIWADKEYVVVAVIKIHFKPHTIKRGSHETEVIKKLSKMLGTELLSWKLKRDSIRAMETLARDRINACNILADSLRNVLTKTGLIRSLIKQEIGFLRNRWEELLLKELHQKDEKRELVIKLNEILESLKNSNESFKKDLIDIQNSFLKLNIPPESAMHWIDRKITERWKTLMEEDDIKDRDRVMNLIRDLKDSIYFGKRKEVLESFKKIPDSIKNELAELLYNENNRMDSYYLNRLIKVLKSPQLDIPFKDKTIKSLSYLKALHETMTYLERNTNFLINQVMNGCNENSPSRC